MDIQILENRKLISDIVQNLFIFKNWRMSKFWMTNQFLRRKFQVNSSLLTSNNEEKKHIRGIGEFLIF